ncbi:hypothetical protein DL96DRAFT_237159 [Flagelloscypha sp. PMI_526]|nr:hypothetical protein DL96DRAFT_237159 [Flagelloscypha sp. PMI_526]
MAIQEKNIEPVPDLPTDILWTIFSAAASDSILTAYKLSFVSKEVQKWVDPFLFQRISIGYNPAHLTNAIGASCRLSYATQFTKEVHVTRTLTSPADMNPFVEAFSQLPAFKALSARVTPQGRYGSWNISIPGVEVRHLYWELDSAKLGALRHLSSNFTHLAIDVTSQVAFQYDWSALNGLKTIAFLLLMLWEVTAPLPLFLGVMGQIIFEQALLEFNPPLDNSLPPLCTRCSGERGFRQTIFKSFTIVLKM